MTTAAMVPYGALTAANVILPAVYERVIQALAACESLDECLKWEDRAAAAASYHRQWEDPTIFNAARRIQARASRRCGELLKAFENRGGKGVPERRDGGDTTLAPVSQHEAAEQAGMSKRQEVTAVRVANVPEEAFKAAVESEHPASVTKLAKMGTTSRVQAERKEPAVEDGKLDTSRAGVLARVEKIRVLAAEGWSVPQIATEVGMAMAGCAAVIKREGIDVPAKTMGKTRHHDATRIVETMVMTAENLTADVPLIEFGRLDHVRLAEWIAALTTARTSLTQFIHRLTKEMQKDV